MEENKEMEERAEQSLSKEELHAKYDVPSEAPGFEGATPQALGRLLFTRVKPEDKNETDEG